MSLTKLTILHSNDMHGDFMAEETDKKLIGGISMLSGYIKKVRSEEENVIYAIAGDMFKGSIIDSEYKGISTVELMNILNPDIVTLGNHEMDYGIAHLLFLEKCARFPIINANLYIKTNHRRLFEPFKNITVGGMKILFIGILTSEVLAQTKNEEIIGSFIDVREAAKEIGVICDNYKTTDTDYTVVLTHIGFDKDKELASLIDPNCGVDLIIGGHSHTLLDKPEVVCNIPIVQAGTGTDQIGRLDIVYDTDKKQVVEQTWETIQINNEHCPSDSILEDTLNSYKTQTDLKYKRILTTFKKELTHPSRIQETQLGNLFSDMLQKDSSFDVMLFGSGSIRKTALGPIVDYQGLMETVPYDDPVYMVEVTGAQFRQMISFVLRDEAFEGHTEFYQYSKGVEIVYSKSEKALKVFKLNGQDIQDDQHIKIALQSYHFNNFTDFFSVEYEQVAKNYKPRMVITSCRSIYEELMSSSNMMDANVEGRLVLLD